ncbi:polyprenyl synthetase family protein [Porticoccaceae bacterium LTM1]|nr:polyprenyl synthetase family protein [Porticoccaceae bacterium LTM1]
MLPFHRAVEDDFLAVNDLIINQLHSDVGLVENIGQYIVDAGGKRLRPLLVLLAANACGYQGKRHIELAAIVEFIHTATLLHDDVVDTSNMRRGRATANAKWGNAPSVLVGDFLYSRAFQMMVAIGDMDIMRILADATNIISEGEVQQLINAGNPNVTEDSYNEVIRKKTAQLFEAAAHCGAVLATEDSTRREAMRRYGHHLGMAFQLVDDVLDYQGDAESLGKNVGDDLAEGKPTLPLIAAMKNGTEEQATLIRSAIENASLDNLDAVVEVVKSTGALDYTMACAKRHSELAAEQLDGLVDSTEAQAMRNLAEFAISRTY